MLELTGYRINETLHATNISTVYRADHETRGAVVLKTTASELPRPSEVARLRREFALGSSLKLPGVVSYLEAKETAGSVVLVLEDFGARSLAQIMKETRLEVPQMLDISIGLSEALSQLHGQQLIHRDISPGNVFYNPRTGALKLGDLGLASSVPRSRQATVPPERLEGTIAYISPEQTGRMNRAIDYRTDLYSLGAVLYHLTTGRIPFYGADLMSIVHGHIAKAPLPPNELYPEIPEALSQVILKLMAKAAEDRYQSADGVAADLVRIRDALKEGGLEGFQPAGHALKPLFTLSERLYGRETQTEELLAAFERVAEGGCELLLVTGPAGIGKTMLVNEVHKPIVARRGSFTTGKYDLYGRGQPLSALLDALSGLLLDVLSSPEEELAVWRQRISGALGDEAAALADVLPELGHVLGEVPAVEEVPAGQVRERFDRLVANFLRLFASEDKPLVIFLDDLQWVDPASLRLLAELITDPDTHNLFIIGAYRDDEVDAAHPLSVALGELTDTKVNSLQLGPLAEDDIASLIADSTERQMWDATPLADLLHQKTGGNPFFVAQFVLDLVDDSLIRLGEDRSQWVWDMDEIRQRSVAETAVQFMVDKLGRYSGSCQALLRAAGCLGNTFDLGLLGALVDSPVRDVAARMWAPVRDGLVLPLGSAHDLFGGGASDDAQELRCKFAHDRIQEAALSSIPADKLDEMHLKIGRVLYSLMPQSEQSERLFEYIGHFNQGASLLNQDEKQWLAGLNFQAGLRAKESTAYEASVGYFERAGALTGEDWDTGYDLLADLHLQRVESIYLAGDTDGAMEAFRQVSPQMRSVLHIAGLSQIVMRILQTENRVEEGVEEGLRCLALLNSAPPSDPEKIGERMGQLGASIGTLLGEKGPQALIEGPRLENPEIIAKCGVLQETWICALMASNLPMVAFTTLSVVHISLEHGISDVSPAGYVAQAALCALQGDYDGARLFGTSGLELAASMGGSRLRPMVLNTYGNFTGHMVAPLQQNVDRYEESYRTCLLTGDRWWGSWAVHWARVHRFLKGDVLDDVNARALAYHAYIQESGYVPLVLLSDLDLAIFANLMGKTRSHETLDYGDFDEGQLEKTLQDANFGYGLYVLYTFQAWLAYLYKDYERALDLLDKADPYKDLIPGGPAYASYFFYGALVLAANLEDASPCERLTRFDEYAGRLANWSQNGCADNFQHMHEMLCGERARLAGAADSLHHYDAAIEGARRAGYIQHAAMACELAAHSLAEAGHPRAGHGYLQEALQLYRSWGAEAKGTQMVQRHPVLWSAPATRSTATGTVTSHSHETDGLDIATVLKASAAISREIDQDRLLKTVLSIVLENAGAQRGALLLEDNGLYLRAVGGTGDVTVQTDAPLDEQSDLPQSVIRYVARAKEAVIEQDAVQQGRFQSDPYVQSARVRSVLCLPLIHQRKLIGVLYAENNLAASAFTPQSVELLQLLSTQAAISLENAALYANLREALERQTHITQSFERFVPKQFLEHLGRSSITDVQLGDQVQREMTVLFMDARNFTSVSENLSAKQTFALVNRLLARVGPIVRRHGGFIDKYIGDAIMALFPGSVDGACTAALEIQQAVSSLRKEASGAAQAGLEVGVGVHCGIMMLGTIGETERMDSTVISDAVNIASRLEGMTKEEDVGIIISQDVLSRLDDPQRFTTRSLGASAVKGRNEPIGIHALEG